MFFFAYFDGTKSLKYSFFTRYILAKFAFGSILAVKHAKSNPPIYNIYTLFLCQQQRT